MGYIPGLLFSGDAMPVRMNIRRWGTVLLALCCVVGTAGCAPLKNWAMNQVAGILADSSVTFHTDDDPDLVAEALPFALKLIEGTLQERPHHRKLLLKACSGFTEYAYGFVKLDADRIEDEDFEEAEYQRDRARRLFLRARRYGLRALEQDHSDFFKRVRQDPRPVVAEVGERNIGFLYWTAAAWGAAIGVALDEPDLVADQPVVEVMLERALELDETYEDGAIHSAMITVEMARQGGEGEPEVRAKYHFERAVELSHGLQAAPYVAYAEAVCVKTQNRDAFRKALEGALTIDVDAVPERRTANMVMQRRARWLLDREDDLFVRNDATRNASRTIAVQSPTLEETP